jgi:Leucine-rich repeat (LRR) protein
MDMSFLAACSGLQQLQLWHPVAYDRLLGERVAEQLPHLKAMTQLIMVGVVGYKLPLDGPVPAGVWQLTQLQHLNITHCWEMEALPDAISSLRQLTQLSLANTGIAELPHQLGVWMPQLQGLCVTSSGYSLGLGPTQVSSIPLGLSRLTHLDITRCRISSVSAVEHLVALKVLRIAAAFMQAPFEPLTKLTALEQLEIWVESSDEVVLSSPLPRLHTLVLDAADPVPVLQQLVGGARCLTRLELRHIGSDAGGGLLQLGPLPALRVLDLADQGCHAQYDTLSTWLQQQEHVTHLALDMGGYFNGPNTSHYVAPVVCGLPPHLEQLHLKNRALWRLPACLYQCTSLRVLNIGQKSNVGLDFFEKGCPNFERKPTGYLRAAGVEHLAQLPLLRVIQLKHQAVPPPLLMAAPHLCWGSG